MASDCPVDSTVSDGVSELRQNDVRVWFAELDQPDVVLHCPSETISPDERLRAMRFRFPHDQRRFIVARAILRTILGRYLEIDPRQVSFQYGQYGKPALAQPHNTQLQFNISHSAGAALFAVAPGRQVGADLEYIRPLTDLTSLANDCFSTSEIAALSELPEREKLRAFFDGWTRKEAFLKATGLGLSLSTKVFEVSLSPGEGPRELRLFEGARDRDEWSLVSLVPRAECSAAVVAEGRDCRITFAEWATPQQWLG
jgi:4'-phosphopantetheinyl transferase